MSQAIDHVALLPGYLVAATAVTVLLADLFLGRRGVTIGVAAVGFTATGTAAGWLATQPARQTFCTVDGCSYVTGVPGAVIAVTLCGLALAVLALSTGLLRGTGEYRAPTGEYVFLLSCSLAGGVILAYARDLITLVVALETLTLPLYVLVAMRGESRRSAEAAVNFLLVSVAASTVTLFGAAMLYAATGAVHLTALAAALSGAIPTVAAVGAAMVLAGLAFKLAAVPLHGWAPGTYDGAPLPIAAYLSTASKLGGVAALLWVVTEAFSPIVNLVGPILLVLAVATMTIGNLVALRQRRTVRLLAWSSIAQAGYLLVPLGGYAVVAADITSAATAVLVFALFYVVMELAAFAAVIRLRGADRDGGSVDDLAGSLRSAPVPSIALLLAVAALAGLPPGLAGLFAKVTVISAVADLLPWLAVVVAINAVIGLVYYLRFGAVVVRAGSPARPTTAWPTTVVLTVVTGVLVLVGLAPQLLWDLAAF
ncbi:NADH-quinone oxidoreductase subunit N [Stackebrandtia endophytica]|uniref:NADH-quinone oxidoreductase subunit N n=1 Tax=Stackebrandtia endophytica TaxID=1496996 RepID=A0A543AUZ0_9ACTN|nr:NADH-quinone oxidoreductase subunit N [Stackebrandtia endophytica]TQL76361.1 NADH-quinone oxidoreductase subunit N [Stackebrandtia endophytica]